MLERTKVMDQIFIKHQVKLHELQQGIKDYDLENDEDVKALKGSQLAERKQMQEKQKEENKLSEEDQSIVKKIMEEIGTVDGTPDISGNMTKDNYEKLFEAVIRVQVHLMAKVE